MAWPMAGHGSLIPGANDLDLTFARWSLQFPTRDMQEISPLPNAGSELAIAPAEPLAVARPTARNSKWPAAIIVSGLLHGAAAAFFLISPSGRFDSPDTMQSEGSDQTGDKVTGSALDKDPAAVNVRLVPNPQPPTKPSQPERQAAEPIQEAAKPLPEAVKQPAVTPDILVAASPRPDNQSVPAKVEASAQPSVQAESTQMPVAIPHPISSLPSRIERGSGLRLSQPKASAPWR